jgi:protease IV
MQKQTPLLTALAITALTTLPSCAPVNLTIGGPPTGAVQPTLVKSDGQWFSDRIDIIDVSGLIYNGNGTGFLASNDNPVGLLYERLQAAQNDPHTKAVILRINSPGGTVTGSEAMYRLITDFKAKTGKPVVTCVQDMAASGGYYVACASDEIICYPSSILGSIGVLIQTVSFKPALSRWGITTDAITSGKNKAAGNPLEEMTPEQRAIFKTIVDEFYAQFVGIVKAARPNIPSQKLADVTDGRIFSGTQAIKLGMVDHLGDLDTAITRAKALAKIKNADVYIHARPRTFIGSPYAANPGSAPSASAGSGTQYNMINIDASLGKTNAPGFYYIWAPGE